MKILLINPPDLNTLVGNNPEIIESERGYNPPLGLLYLASYIKEFTQHDVKVLDTQVEELNFDQIKQEIQDYNPDVVGMTTMSFTISDCLTVAELAKEVNKEIKVVFGGPHPHIFPKETINLPNVDFLTIGEGESTIVDFIENIDDKEKLKQVPGLIFKHNEEIIQTPLPPLIEDLDKIPFPNRTLTNYKKYTSLLAKRSPITTMITSRGCPYKCIFCDRPHLGKVFRARSAENVIKEIEECVNLGIKEILIYDDTFTIDRQRAIDICDELIKRKYDITFDIRARVNTVDLDLLKKLKKAGCERIHFGVESGNQDVLNKLRKGITLEQVRHAFKLTKKAGISTLGYFMIGSPTETKETVMQTINFAKSINCDFAHFTITTPFPSTDLYREGLANGIIKRDYWREFAENPTKDFKPPFWEENLNRDELIELVKLAYKKFYSRPFYLVKRLFKIRSFQELKRKTRAGIKVLRL
jgi:anaerobic magnesium-protoporphyrin IX monomethyl ester cyclase